MAKHKITLTCPRCNRNHSGNSRTQGTLSTVCLICVGTPPKKPAPDRRRMTNPDKGPHKKD